MPYRALSKFATVLAVSATALTIHASTIPYPNKGTVAPTVNTYATSSNGVGVDLYFYGSSAAYNDGIQILDLTNGYESGEVMGNHSSTPGSMTTVGAGSINKGDQIVFLLDVNGTTTQYASDPAYSADGANHVYITSYSGGTINGMTVPAGLFLGFEDEPVGASDLDYNDDESIVTGVGTSVTPEPSSLILLGTGALGVAGVLRRRIA